MNFGCTLIDWYKLNKRDLPWRNTRDPYLIWLSEIILQQTRVAQGVPYYFKFVNAFTNITSFANATEDEVLKLWQGLGYYSRARNMLKTAKVIKNNCGGIFPTAYDDLIKLKGIGPYTASAISSFSVDEKRAVVDGNVYRVIARYMGIDNPTNSNSGIKVFQILANSMMESHVPSLYNQAIMEFGALVCTPKKPKCSHCMLRPNCWALANNKVELLPVKLKKTASKKRFMYFFVVRNGNKLIIKRRKNDDIWAGLYDFPSIESKGLLAIEAIVAHHDFKLWFGNNAIVNKIHKPIKHLLTHQTIYAQFIEVCGAICLNKQPPEWLHVSVNELENYAQPKLIFAFLKKYLT
ncbi:MAG: A/G-specific adenine glycosylase [Sphingobacteriales bacterium]|nr:MAG: A/G-specific adenine glycosylase [Sphingobacteriales bacterium]TAF82096.1 MAG: A/G-specific adenine glycosylase [Sphingobacteriales bacterium]